VGPGSSKATEITKAEQEKAVALLQASKNKEVAALDLESAKLAAEKVRTEAKADADAKKMALKANNALELRLGVYKEIAIAQANALGSQPQVPSIVMGGTPQAGGTNLLMELLAAKAAKDLGVSSKP
jgi:hypothetical protein